jgi:hypothetical protein
VPFPKYSQDVRHAEQGFISPYFGYTLNKKTHRVFLSSLTRYDRFDNSPGDAMSEYLFATNCIIS